MVPFATADWGHEEAVLKMNAMVNKAVARVLGAALAGVTMCSLVSCSAATSGTPPAQLAALTDGMGASLGNAGVTLDLAPVADVVPAGTAASNPPIGVFDRQYGSTAAQVQAVRQHQLVTQHEHHHGIPLSNKQSGKTLIHIEQTAPIVQHRHLAAYEEMPAGGAL